MTTDATEQQLGSYRLLRLLGRGAFADVYLAEHLYLKTLAAIKVLSTRLDERAQKSFLAEARILYQLEHPRIIRLLDYAVERDTPYLVMEYAPGGTLRTRHPRGTSVPFTTVVTYIKQIASALQHAHNHRLIHRDLKPENLLLGAYQQVLLSDFGIALVINSAEYLNVSALSGTLSYMAPEQLRGKVQVESDQYSLGVIAYELLCGQPPFQGTLTEICSQHLLEKPPSLCKLQPDLPRAVEEVVLRALAKEPEARFPDISAFADALEAAGEDDARYRLFLPEPCSPPEPEVEPRHQEPTHIPFNNLPLQMTTFIGRDEVRKAASVLLVRPEIRLLTMVGVGGIGKTSLAISVAAGLAQTFPDGVCFVSLAPLSDPRQVLPTIALTLGLREQGGGTLSENLQDFLRKKHLLLILDNFEQLTPAAPQLAGLLRACPKIKLLVTSRAVLHVSGEQVFPVPPLERPELEDYQNVQGIEKYEAIQLFVERARALRPDFKVDEENARILVAICRRLDGLPLAIELAAARINLLSPVSLLARLSRSLSLLTSEQQDIPERQRTLRKTIEWSYDLLTSSEQRLFRRLALFVDGATLSMIESLYSFLNEDPLDVLNGISSLLDKSLLLAREQKDGEQRYFLLETLREFGLECLGCSGEREQSMRAFAACYLNFLARLHRQRPLLAFDAPVETIEPEYSNIRTVLEGLIAYKEHKTALYLAAMLTGFWFLHGTLSEGRALLEEAIKNAKEAQQEQSELGKVLAAAYSGAGWLAYWQHDYVPACDWLEASLPLYQQTGQQGHYARALGTLAAIEMEREEGDYARGDALRLQGLEIEHALNEEGGIAHYQTFYAVNLLHRGKITEARAICQEMLAHYETLGYTWLTAINLHYLGWISYLECEIEEALALTDDALERFRSLGMPIFMDEALLVSALEHLLLEDEECARAHLEEVLRLGRQQENKEYIARALYGLGRLALHRGDLQEARASFEECVRVIATLSYVDRLQWALASALEGLGSIALAEQQAARAALLCAVADARRHIGEFYTLLGREHFEYEELLSGTRAALGEKEFVHCWQEGKSLSPLRALAAQQAQSACAPEAEAASLQPDEKAAQQKHTGLPAEAIALGLTRREMDVLTLLALGLTNGQIAERLVLSVVTVNSYLRSIYSKMGVTSRTAATRYALEHQLLDDTV